MYPTAISPPPPCPKDLEGFKLEDLKTEKCSIHKTNACACWTRHSLQPLFQHCRKKYAHVKKLFDHYAPYFEKVKTYLLQLNENDVESMREYLKSVNFDESDLSKDEIVKREVKMTIEQIEQFEEMLEEYKTSITKTLESDVEKELEKWERGTKIEDRRELIQKVSEKEKEIAQTRDRLQGKNMKGFSKRKVRKEEEAKLQGLEQELVALKASQTRETMDVRAAIGRHEANCHMYETGIIEQIKRLTGFRELKPLDRVPAIPPSE